MYCRAMEVQLAKVTKAYPSLQKEASMATALWRSSPFARGAAAIERDLKVKGGAAAVARLEELDKKVNDEVSPLAQIKSEAEAREFFDLVVKRASGAIEEPMVRGNLLWNCPPYRERPEQELDDGFSVEIKHPGSEGMEYKFRVPMSWKATRSSGADTLSFKNAWGHGTVWLSVTVTALRTADGQPTNGQAEYDATTRESMQSELTKAGVSLKSFQKTKVNNLPAISLTREQSIEESGERANAGSRVMMVMTSRHMVNFQISAFGPEQSGGALARLEKFAALFERVVSSLTLPATAPAAAAPAKQMSVAEAKAGAEKGDAASQLVLGTAYLSGDGVARDEKEGLKWVLASAEQGYARAQTALGLMYESGSGVARDDIAALFWLRKAGEQRIPEAQYSVGNFYAAGRGGPADQAEAVKWWRAAAEGNYREAQFNLAVALRDGSGVNQDDAEAAKWFEKAAVQGLAEAQSALGILYTAGRGVPQNGRKAVEWLLKAAEQGLPEAQGGLGVLYSGGKGVPRDLVVAHAWYSLAIANGATDALTQCTLIERALSAKEKAASAALLKELTARVKVRKQG